MLKDANNIYKKFYGKDKMFVKKEAQEWSNILKKGLIGIYNHILRFVKTKAMVEEVLMKDEKFIKLLKDNELPTNTKDFMKEMNKFYFQIDKNNKARKAQNSISIFLAEKTKNRAAVIPQPFTTGL